MSIGRLENSVNPLHLVTPDRVVVPMPKRFEASPGVMPFHRMLEAENLANRTEIQPVDKAEIPRPHDTFEPSSTGLMPKLGEVLPVTPIAIAAIKVQETRQVHIPATGQVLDLYL